ncbi:MAG: LCP family protein, partial [Candidatus Magasanikbacteria bacterium]|nr:LCP family protein [Candidatus Magasanikbacteria bacterium]
MHVNFLEPQYPYQGEGKKKMIVVIFLCFIVGGLFAGAAWAGAKVFNAHNDATIAQKVAPIDTSFVGKLKSLLLASSNQSMLGLANNRINIALLGIGGEGHDGAQLTDTILIANIQPSTKKVALLSIPRDTVVEIPGYGFHKINEANSDGEQISEGTGPDLALQTLDNFLGIEIPYYVRVDFSGFEQVVDDIGGVDVYVDKPFTDMDFPTWDFKTRTISFSQGWQHFDGARALDYARSRHGNNFEGSDFARARRQQKLLVAVRDKLLSTETFLHPTRITD